MEEHNIMLSVIIPAYNEEKYIYDCISSVLNQRTGYEYEVIVVDNNSKDATGKIASKFDVNLIVEKKPGASAARNTGARAAKGRILYFLDADCRLPEGIIEKICTAFRDNPKLNLLVGIIIYDRDGLLPYIVTGKLNYFYFYHKLMKMIFGVITISGGNFAIRKGLFQDIQGFDETICNQEIVLPDDLDFAIRLSKHGIKDSLFSRDYKVFSSFRRVKKSPIKHTLIRFFAGISMLRKRR